jgi:predicted Zn-dependent protease
MLGWSLLVASLAADPLVAPPGCDLPGLHESPRMPGVPFEELERRAASAWSADRVQDAFHFYRAGVELNPLWAEGRWRMALVFSARGCDLEARDALRRLLELAPDSGPAWALLGVSEYRLGEFDRAFGYLSRVGPGGLPEGASGFEARRVLAMLLVRRADYAAASPVLAVLAREKPDDDQVRMTCGLMALRMARLPSEVEPENEDLVRAAGRAAAAAFAGRTEEAHRAFDALVARYPKSRGVHLAYGLVLSREASPEALAMLRAEVAAFPDNAEAQTELAFEVLARGNPKDALAPARAAVDLSPRSFWSQLALGRALLAADEVEPATPHLEEAARLAPEVREIYVALAQAYGRAGRTQDLERARATLAELNRRRGAGAQ